jgi:hypothetical protein
MARKRLNAATSSARLQLRSRLDLGGRYHLARPAYNTCVDQPKTPSNQSVRVLHAARNSLPERQASPNRRQPFGTPPPDLPYADRRCANARCV